ncbi:hypothetical protein [Burkholderia glumae]|uniref:hypothetical protein n=1 Tax=Burkholderia glumae TaxID=337 RepID=UPI003B9CB968
MKKFEYAGKRYVIVPHGDGSVGLSEDVTPSKMLIVGTWDEVTSFIRTKIGDPVVWLD